ncbi:putative membrane protein [Caldalkalibacillus uzonensis]|uniref:Membrane protein n=1 Tax=Caldalkalibacillus uzonensis TaxID=353224 RepID=A0ABU0CTF9_9BACI|nr:DUF1648 domain-containing protein [Caldalkalibacillus uzonensis]MDQ0339665.1 putative membrane protein [Caldalkalibacillus uzonensis]
MGTNHYRTQAPERPPLISALDVVLYLLLLAALVTGVLFRPMLPEKIAVHFNPSGEPTRYESSSFTLWFIPVLGMGLVLFNNLMHWLALSWMYYFQTDSEEDAQQNGGESGGLTGKQKQEMARLFAFLKVFLTVMFISIQAYVIYWNMPGTDSHTWWLRIGVDLLIGLFFVLLGLLFYRSHLPVNIPWWPGHRSQEVNQVFNKRMSLAMVLAGLLLIVLSIVLDELNIGSVLIVTLVIPLAGIVWGIIAAQRIWKQLKEGHM